MSGNEKHYDYYMVEGDDVKNAERKSADRLYHLANEYVAYYEQLLEESGE